jgi:hypothetical protein
MLVEKMMSDTYDAGQQSPSYDRHRRPSTKPRLFTGMIKDCIWDGTAVMGSVGERHFATDAEGRVLDGGVDVVHGTCRMGQRPLRIYIE